jgi:hypothetical protein
VVVVAVVAWVESRSVASRAPEELPQLLHKQITKDQQ